MTGECSCDALWEATREAREAAWAAAHVVQAALDAPGEVNWDAYRNAFLAAYLKAVGKCPVHGE
jgi:hypothetical protein